MDPSGQDPPSKKEGKSGNSREAKDFARSTSKEKTPEKSHGERKGRKSSSTNASQLSSAHTQAGGTPPGLDTSGKRRHSKSSDNIPAPKGHKEEPPRDGTASARPNEKDLTSAGTRKPSLPTEERTSGNPATLKISATAVEPAAVDFSSGSPDLKSIGVNVLKSFVFPTEVVSVFVLVMAFTFFVGEFMHDSPKPVVASTLTCPEESHALLRALNDQVKPCENFYGHVCSKIDAGNPAPFSPLMKGAVTAALVDFAETGFHSSAAGMLGAALHKSSADPTPPTGSSLVDYVKAIVRVGAVDASSPMTALQLVRFFAKLSLTYRLPALVSFKVSGTLLSLERNDGCFLDYGRKIIIDGAELNAIKEALHTNFSLPELKGIEEKLAEIRDNGDSFVERNAAARSPFSDVPDSDWEGVLREFLFPAYPDVKEVQLRRGDKLSQVISELAKAPSHALAYPVICTAMRTRAGADQALARSSPPLEIPVFQALDICELEDAVLAAATSAECRDKFILGLFDRLRGKVAEFVEKSFLRNAANKTIFDRILGNLSVAFPQKMVASHVPVPGVKNSFADNLLAARSYAFDIRKEKVALNIPGRESLFSRSAVRRSNVIYLPTYLYALVPQDCESKANRFPAIGMELTFHLWSYVLEQVYTEEKWRTEPHLECFRKTHGNASDNEGYRRIASASLAVATLFDDVLSQQRRGDFTIEGTQVPLERFAYIVWLFDRCSFLPEWLKPGDVNVVLKNVGPFLAAFNCPRLDRCLGK